MDYSKLGYCPHVVTEDRKDAEIYCLICAPQVVDSLRSRIRKLEEGRITHENCKCLTDPNCLMHDYELRKSVKQFKEDMDENRHLAKENTRLREGLELALTWVPSDHAKDIRRRAGMEEK